MCRLGSVLSRELPKCPWGGWATSYMANCISTTSFSSFAFQGTACKIKTRISNLLLLWAFLFLYDGSAQLRFFLLLPSSTVSWDKICPSLLWLSSHKTCGCRKDHLYKRIAIKKNLPPALGTLKSPFRSAVLTEVRWRKVEGVYRMCGNGDWERLWDVLYASRETGLIYHGGAV